jgi:hypothetical protein
LPVLNSYVCRIRQSIQCLVFIIILFVLFSLLSFFVIFLFFIFVLTFLFFIFFLIFLFFVFSTILFHFLIFRIFQVTKKSNYSILEYSTQTHPIMRFAVESYPKAAFVVWCCTNKYTVESKKIQHFKTAPSSMFCCLISVSHGFECCRYCSKKAFCSCIHVVVVVIINLLKFFC